MRTRVVALIRMSSRRQWEGPTDQRSSRLHLEVQQSLGIRLKAVQPSPTFRTFAWWSCHAERSTERRRSSTDSWS